MIMGDMKHLDAYKAQMPDFIYEVLKEASQFDFAGVPDGKYKILRPIPQAAIDLNQATIEQNPGY